MLQPIVDKSVASQKNTFFHKDYLASIGIYEPTIVEINWREPTARKLFLPLISRW